jgi:hypothetical protein
LDGNNFCPIFSDRLPVETASRLVMPTSWTGHVPFAFWLVSTLQPRVIVELGVHTGTSYCAFCEEVKRGKFYTSCFGIDTWHGDEHSGFYGEEVLRDLREFHDPRYDSFSTLIQTTFDEAVAYFADGSIDLLHIDGLHTDEAVRHDFEMWRTKLSDRAVVLFHDTNVRYNHFGVWRFWEELKATFPHFEFIHSHGLGALGAGKSFPPAIKCLFELDSPETASLRSVFASLGHNLTEIARLRYSIETEQSVARFRSEKQEEADRLSAELQRLQSDHSQLSVELQRLQSDHSELSVELQRLQSDHSQTSVELEHAKEEASVLRTQLKQRTEHAEHVAARFAQMRAQLHATENELEAQLKQASQLEAELRAVVRSTSRRITPPIRWAQERWRGLRSRRDAILVARSGLFDKQWYLDRNPDVARSGLDPLIHFVLYGGQEGRDPGEGFRIARYLERYPDTLRGVNPLVHYLRAGRARGQVPP